MDLGPLGLILNRRRMKQSTKIVTLSAARSGSPRLQSEGHFLDQNQSEKKPIVAPISRAVDNFRKKYQADMESVDAEVRYIPRDRRLNQNRLSISR